MSDLLICGMEMPKDGHWGTVSIPFYIHGDGSVSDSKGHIIGSAAHIPPHGDLIDRKALVNDKYATFTIEEEGLWGIYRDKGVWLSAVENAPAIIPASEEYKR